MPSKGFRHTFWLTSSCDLDEAGQINRQSGGRGRRRETHRLSQFASDLNLPVRFFSRHSYRLGSTHFFYRSDLRASEFDVDRSSKPFCSGCRSGEG